MSLIMCPECGKEISDQAKSCPNCGFPIPKEKIKIELNSMHKKILIVTIIATVVIIGGVIGISKITNTPEHVMKQYVKAINSKNQKALEKLIFTGDEYNISDLKDKKIDFLTEKITSYKYRGKLIESDNDKIPLILYKNSEEIDVEIDELYTYETFSNNEEWGYDVKLSRIDGKWKVVDCPFMRRKDKD